MPERADDLAARLQAVGLWQPDAVITGSAAARLTFWPTLTVNEIEVAWHGHSPQAPGYTFSQRRIAPEHVVETGGARITTPALTAVDLCGSLGGDPIDTLLRSRMARIPDLWTALEEHRHRRGNHARRRLLIESRDEPWSAAERESHHLLHVHRIGGWTANYPVLIRGQRYFIDVAFVSARLAIEIDGRLHEDDPVHLRARPLPAERPRTRRLAGAPVHVEHADPRPRVRGRHHRGGACGEPMNRFRPSQRPPPLVPAT